MTTFCRRVGPVLAMSFAMGMAILVAPPPAVAQNSAGQGSGTVAPAPGGGTLIFNMPNLPAPNLPAFNLPANPAPVVAMTPIVFPSKPASAPLCGGVVNGVPQPRCNDMAPHLPAVYESPAVGVCPPGSFFDIGKWQCWSCPAGYSRTTAAVDTPMACSRPNANVRGAFLGARLIGPVCPAGSFFDPIRDGECWSCPVGYNRSAAHVEAPNACVQPAREELKYAALNRRTPWPHECAAGQFHDGWNGGGCWSCAAGFNRTGYPIYSDRACSRAVSEVVARATVRKRAFCEPGTVRDGRLDLPLAAPERIAGGQCWQCPDGAERTVFPVAGGQACEKGGGREFARATKVQDLTCPAGQHFDFIGVSGAELGELNRSSPKRAGAKAQPAQSGTCWSCPQDYVRTVHGVKSGQACELRKIGWRTPSYPEPGLFGLAAAEQAVVEFLRNRRALIDEAIVEFARAGNLPLEATRKEMWGDIRNAPHNSAILKMAMLDRLRAAFEASAQATPAEMAMLQSFAAYVQARRTYIAENALALYDAWYASDQYWRRQNSQQATLVTMLDYGTVPPDFYDVAHAGALSGLVTGPALSFGGLYGIAKGIPSIMNKIFPYAAKAAKRAAQQAAMRASEKVVQETVKQTATLATKASGAAARILVYAGPQIIIAAAIEVIQAATEQFIEIQNARPKLLTRLAEAKQPVDLARMLRTESGVEEFNGYWMMATSGERRPSAQTAAMIAALVN